MEVIQPFSSGFSERDAAEGCEGIHGMFCEPAVVMLATHLARHGYLYTFEKKHPRIHFICLIDGCARFSELFRKSVKNGPKYRSPLFVLGHPTKFEVLRAGQKHAPVLLVAMDPPEGTAFPIPKLYWDAFQSTVQAQTKRLAKEIAASLRQPENPLLRALQADKVSVYLFEEEGSEYVDIQSLRCSELRRNPDSPSVLEPCGQPVVIGQGKKCPHHLQTKKLPVLPSLQKLRIIRDSDTATKYWLTEENLLLTSEMVPVGRYNPETRRVFVFAE